MDRIADDPKRRFKSVESCYIPVYFDNHVDQIRVGYVRDEFEVSWSEDFTRQ